MSNSKKQSNTVDHFDVLIIGGGINGAGIARSAAGCGYSVCLADSGDPGAGTSSASTKLIHGGLRYLEYYKFGLVREALLEREVLWKMAPHIIRPMRFVLPHHRDLRPLWLLRLGLFIYDHLGGRKLLPPTRLVDLKKDETGKPLKEEFSKALEYSDCWVEDSRLVILNLRSARELGATVLPRTAVKKASYENDKWHVDLENKAAKKSRKVTASIVINATGPWVDSVLRSVFGINNANNVRLVRGSHIVIKKKFQHDKAYIFQNADSRIIFAIPYEGDFTLVGTTDAEHESIENPPEITEEEKAYLCEMATAYFREAVSQDDIVWAYSGVRPLYDDGASKAQEATREYVIRSEPSIGNGSLINIFGGKITTYRSLAKAMMHEIGDRLDFRHPSSADHAPLPGGDFPVTGFQELIGKYARKYAFLDKGVIKRLVNLYGTDTEKILGDSKKTGDLGKDFGCGLYEAEVEFLKAQEWVQEADDILYRRTKLGIHMSPAQIKKLHQWFS